MNHQMEHNAVFGEFVYATGQDGDYNPVSPPFLPIELFKSHRVSCMQSQECLFRSSGTGKEQRSTHAVFDASLYRQLSRFHFESLYGKLENYVLLALLPSYVENGDSSLVYMVNHFISNAAPESGFVLHDPGALRLLLHKLKEEGQPTLLIGVSYALLDFSEYERVDFPELIVMETGGMKGRREELTREELHAVLRNGFPSSPIHSEYGMTELLSQAYATDGKNFIPPGWMKAYVTDISDPLQSLASGNRGLLAFVDLANYHSCSFVQTRDIGVVNPDGSFVVEGRLDNSDLRGCNLLYT